LQRAECALNGHQKPTPTPSSHVCRSGEALLLYEMRISFYMSRKNIVSALLTN